MGLASMYFLQWAPKLSFFVMTGLTATEWFKVTQGQPFQYRSKAHMQRPISEEYFFISYLTSFPSYRGILVNYCF